MLEQSLPKGLRRCLAKPLDKRVSDFDTPFRRRGFPQSDSRYTPFWTGALKGQLTSSSYGRARRSTRRRRFEGKTALFACATVLKMDGYRYLRVFPLQL
jgi:hypothetical protein